MEKNDAPVNGDQLIKLSVILITFNEEAVIRRCLESVQFADEIIVVDSGSTDRTQAICREWGAQVVQRDWLGPGTQRNRGIECARGKWILALDADEWVTPQLRNEILTRINAAGAAVVFRIPRSSSYCGRIMRHGGWWPDYVSRLFLRGKAHFAGGIVHDSLEPDGPVDTLHEPLMHEAFVDVEEVLHKVNAYSTWGAQTLFEKGSRSGLAKAIGKGLWSFLRTYFFRAGFLDGREGFMLAVSNAEGTYYKYIKLMLLGRKT